MAAKKKKTTKKKKGSSVGKASLNANNPIIPIVTGIIGLLAAPKANTYLETDLLKGKVDGKVIGFVETGLGAGLLFVKFGKKKTILQVAAGGFAAGMGIRKLLSEFGVITGVQQFKDVPVMGKRHPAPVRRMNGFSNVPALGGTDGYNAPSAMNGTYGTTISKVMGNVVTNRRTDRPR